MSSINKTYGFEIDIRQRGGDIIIQHEPNEDGEKLEDWLKFFNHSFIIFNIKEDGIENKVLKIIKRYEITNYFFLDLSFPSLVKLASSGEKNIASRISKYENINTTLSLKSMVSWVWVDLFEDKIPLSQSEYKILKDHNFKICLVSPELLSRGKDSILKVQDQIKKNAFVFDAVCTKEVELWEK